ncbi:hypothetical protein ACHAXT_006378 [Thalassiosira profunda]
MKRTIPTPLAAAALALACMSPAYVHAFVAPSRSRAKITSSPCAPSLQHTQPVHRRGLVQPQGQTTATSLQMGYQLPPSGPKGPFDDIKALLPTITTGILVALFFASPLGGVFFAITNSLFVLALLTPIVLFVGFQIWTNLYTVEAPCPSCGQLPVRALKSGEPTVCLNCGAYSRANEKGDGLELCNNPNDLMGGGSLFDSLFGMGGNGMSDFVDVGSGSTETFSDPFGGVSPRKEGAEEKAKKAKRQGNIIDVDVERD